MKFFKHKLVGTGFREPPIWAVFCEDRGRVVLFAKTPWGEDVADRIVIRSNEEYHTCLDKDEVVYNIMRLGDFKQVEPVYGKNKEVVGYRYKGRNNGQTLR